MKYVYGSLLLIVIFLTGSLCSMAQITSSTTSEATRTTEVTAAQTAVNKVLFDAGVSFKEGLLAYTDNNRSLAGEKFNKSVEIFLYSTLNIQKDAKLQGCYSQLIETIYRIEFPSENQLPQIKNLSITCGWNIDIAFVDKVTTLVESMLKQPLKPKYRNLNRSKELPIGFNSLEFEPSPLDELAKLELTPDELEIGNTQPLVTEYHHLVKARAGDTVAKVAERYRSDVLEVAKLNGLLPSSNLGAGREIKIPNIGDGETWQTVSDRTGVSVSDLMAANPGMTAPKGKVFIPVNSKTVNTITYSTPTKTTKPNVAVTSEIIVIGVKPSQAKDGKVSIVMNYFKETLHDPYSMRFVRWSPVTQAAVNGVLCWRVAVKYRAKNLLGAYVLSENVFYIRNSKIISTLEL